MTTQTSDVPELVASLEEKLQSGTYECVVCTETIGPRDRLWSCRTCYGVFHLSCVGYWSKSQAEQKRNEAQHSGQSPSASQNEYFRCPHCQSKNLASTIAEYRCYCGKVDNPKMELGLVTGACGQPCQKRREDKCCPHPCTLRCHPGPCPSCTHMRSQSCYCGAEEKTVGCSSGIEGFECGGVCGKELNCGRHYCEQRCHPGPCAACSHIVSVSCYCGSVTTEKPCAQDLGFSCRKPCPKLKDCKLHQCEQLCHEGPCTLCLRIPSRQASCPCGQVPLWKIYYEHPELPPRNVCTDAVPTCGNICQLPLPCGMHLCTALCHDSARCPPCAEMVALSCRCGSSTKKVPCFVQYLPREEWTSACTTNQLNERQLPQELPLQCQKRCKKPLSCGRHQCDEVCCSNQDHLCYQVCRKKAPCGIHECGRLCHRGQCPPCHNSSYERLYCRCRRTWIEPPVPCGTLPPNCQHPCVIPRQCGHPPNHVCHPDDKCPDCVVPVVKECGSHRKQMPYLMPCHLKSVSCGHECGRILTCCNIVCRNVCHGGPCPHNCKNSFPELAAPGANSSRRGGSAKSAWGAKKDTTPPFS